MICIINSNNTNTTKYVKKKKKKKINVQMKKRCSLIMS